jgi:hypothetical protein
VRRVDREDVSLPHEHRLICASRPENVREGRCPRECAPLPLVYPVHDRSPESQSRFQEYADGDGLEVGKKRKSATENTYSESV